jgi:hypothetical protein
MQPGDTAMLPPLCLQSSVRWSGVSSTRFELSLGSAFGSSNSTKWPESLQGSQGSDTTAVDRALEQCKDGNEVHTDINP